MAQTTKLSTNGHVAQHLLRRRLGPEPAARPAADQEQEAQDPERRERRGEPQVVRVEGRARGRVERVGDVREGRGRAGRGEGHRERPRRVRLERGALLAGVLEGELVAALAEAEKQREQRRAGEHVPRDVDVGRDAAGEHAQDEAEGDEAHVEERDLLQLEAVGEVLGEVDERHEGEEPARASTPGRSTRRRARRPSRGPLAPRRARSRSGGRA